MNTKDDSLLGPIIKIVVVGVAAIILMLACFAYTQKQSKNQTYQDRLIINEFEQQKLQIQLITLNSNRLYGFLLESKINNQGLVDKTLKEKEDKVRIELGRTSKKFYDTLNIIENGHLLLDTELIDISESIKQSSIELTSINILWSKLNKKIEILIYARQTNETLEDSVLYINDHNQEMMVLFDDILEHILENRMSKIQKDTTILYLFIGILSVITIISIITLLNKIIEPYKHLIRGMRAIGLSNEPLKSNEGFGKKNLSMVSEVNEVFKKMEYLISLIENMNNNSSFMDVLNYINQNFSYFIPYTYIGIALINKENNTIKASYGVSKEVIKGMPERLMGKSWDIDSTSLGELVRKREPRIINDLKLYTAKKPLKAYNKIILEAGIKASISLPLVVSGEPVGVIFFSSTKKNVYNTGHLKFLKTLVNSIAISLNQNILIDEILLSSNLALAKMAESKDEKTGEHLERMKKYSRVLASLLYKDKKYLDEITPAYIEDIFRFSPLHDIGKVGVRDDILQKPGSLTNEEFSEMQQHTLYGAEILKAAEQNMEKVGKSLFKMGIEIAEGHHEKWDGSGYPLGKKGTQIPLSARIVAVSDVFDALTSKRPYKEPFSLEESFKIIEEGSGKHFDPDIVATFISNKDKFIKIHNSVEFYSKSHGA